MPSAAVEDVHFWTPRVLAPFLLLIFIWGSTWIVIKDQISAVPPSWSVSYRFIAAALALFALLAVRRQPLMLGRRGQLWAVGLGFFQFSANFNFVYRAELYVTSGLVAVMFALLMVPNAILARVWLGQRINRAFLIGSGVAAIGVALLFLQEFRQSDLADGHVLLGIGLTLIAMACASTANVMQATEGAKPYPIVTLLAWAMFWGVAMNSLFALATVGPPVIDPRWRYLGGILYLGVIGSAFTFPLYFAMIRQIGAGRAAYSGVLIPIVAMAISTLAEGYRWSPLAIGGAVLALIGLVIAMGARRPRAPRLQG